MFNLFRRQDTMKRIMLGGILAIVSIGMLLYLIPGQNVPAMAEEQVVAEVGGTKITAREVYRRIQGTFKNNPMPPDVVEVYVPQLIENMIGDQAVAYEAQRMGFKISDAELGKQIRSIPQFTNLPAEQYQAALEQMGYSVPEFENDFRKNAVENMLKDIAAEGVIVPPQEAENAYRQMNEKIKLDYIVFAADKFKSDVNVTPSELQAYYSMKKAGFTIPESRNVQVILIDQDKVAAAIQTPEPQLRAYYDSHKDDFRTPDRVRVRHILLQTVGKSPDDMRRTILPPINSALPSSRYKSSRVARVRVDMPLSSLPVFQQRRLQAAAAPRLHIGSFKVERQGRSAAQGERHRRQ